MLFGQTLTKIINKNNEILTVTTYSWKFFFVLKYDGNFKAI